MTISRRVVMFSGGVSSYLAARRVVDQHGPAGVVLLFADTLIEDEDLYRFLNDASRDLGVPVTRIADGRTPWEVMRDERVIANSRIDPCSKHLKRNLMRRWLRDNTDPADTAVVIGYDWTEPHRLERLRPRMLPWVVEAPLVDPPLVDKRTAMREMASRGLAPPRLYALGFPHNNCGGFCVKAGQGAFAILLREFPERYAAHEAEEVAMQKFLGRDNTILKERRGGESRTLSLTALRERIQGGGQCDLFDLGGCACMEEPDAD